MTKTLDRYSGKILGRVIFIAVDWNQLMVCVCVSFFFFSRHVFGSEVESLIIF